MSGDWIEDVLRLRAQRMVDADLSDRDIDQAIMYSDEADRMVIWRIVHELRALPRPVNHWPEIVDGYRKAKERWGKRPTLEQVASEIPVAEDTLRTWVHGEGILDWRHIHSRMV